MKPASAGLLGRASADAPRHLLLRTAILAFLFLLLTATAAAQRQVVYPVKPLAIVSQGGEVGIQENYLSEKQTARDGRTTSVNFSNNTLQQYLLYRLDGYVYHPRFLTFRTRFKLGLMEQTISRTGGLASGGLDHPDSTTGLYGYDLYLSFLRDHPMTLSLFASHDRTAVLELFTDRQLLETTRQGATLNLKKGPVPMDLTISHNQTREWGADSFSETTYNLLDYAARNVWRDRVYTELRYRFMDYEQDFGAHNRFFDTNRKTTLQSHDVSLTNTAYLDADHGSYLTSTARYYQQSGSQAFETINWQERLNLRHSENFSTYYLFNLLQDRLDSYDVTTRRAEVGFEHQLFQSLHTHGDVHGRWSDFGSSSEDVTGATLRLNYRKRNPLGTFTLGLGETLDQIKRTGTSGVRPVVDEAVTLNDGVNAFLAQTNVNPGSLVVRSADRTVTYDAGFDYEVVQIGGRTALRLIPGGRIADGTAVLASYDITVTQNIDYKTTDQSIYARQEFDRFVSGLAVYYRRQRLAALDAPPGDMSILEFTDWAAGADYNWRWLTVNAEYERYRSNINNYNQMSLRVEGYHRLDDTLRMGWHVGVLNTDYLDDFTASSQDRSIYGGLSFDGHLRPNGYWSVEGRVRHETGQIDENIVGLIGKLGWRWRRVRVEAGGRLEQRDRSGSKRDRTQLYLQVAREFGGREVAGW